MQIISNCSPIFENRTLLKQNRVAVEHCGMQIDSYTLLHGFVKYCLLANYSILKSVFLNSRPAIKNRTMDAVII